MAENDSHSHDAQPNSTPPVRPADFAKGSTDFTERATLPFTVVALCASAGGLLVAHERSAPCCKLERATTQPARMDRP